MNEVFIEVALFASFLAGVFFMKAMLLLGEIFEFMFEFMMESEQFLRLGGRL